MEIPRHWRLKKQRYNLVGEVCPHCDTKIFPPRDICPSCGDQAKEQYTFSGKGEIYSVTQTDASLTLALIKLAEGPMITAQITDLFPGQIVNIGQPVEMVTRKMRDDGDERGLIIYGYKFRPV